MSYVHTHCPPPNYHYHYHHAHPFQYQTPSWHGNLPDAQTGNHNNWFHKDSGYGVDLNNNGRYDRGQDGVIAFDQNRDGRISNQEIKESNERLKAFGGNYDLNGDGHTTICERSKGQRYQREMQQNDLDRDGRLSSWELDRAGGRVVVDHNRNGHAEPHETYSPYHSPTPGFGSGSIGYVDPARNHTQVNNNRWGWAYH
ncbi:MAG: hypothetical protein FJX76_08590 [Armatimonadetes bacterium]|nr:hypothetical protein [Armatimonadota bacterium]